MVNMLFFTRGQEGFIDPGEEGYIGFGLCENINNPQITSTEIVYPRYYHTVSELKNGAGAVPIKTDKGWIHLAHAVRATAAGLRYVIILFVTDLKEPWKVIANPGGYFIAPLGNERAGDVPNVLFTNGAVALNNGDVYIYYGVADTRLCVATTTIEKMLYYAFNTPPDGLRSANSVKQRYELIDKNKELSVCGT